MNNKPNSKLARHAAELDRWFTEERLSAESARARLAALGCAVSSEQLAKWRAGREVRRVQEQLLEQLARGARHCAQVQRQLARAQAARPGAPASAGLDPAHVAAHPANAPAPKLAEAGAPEAAAECALLNADLELETLIKLHRVLVLKLSLEADGAPGLLKLTRDLMRPVMDWARVQEQRQDRALAEQKHRDQLEAQKAARAQADPGTNDGRGLRPQTLEKIERELNLL